MADPLAKLRRKTAWKQKLDALPTTRSCAGCDLCCTILDIPELSKPAWSRCVHLTEGRGCAVWGDHPAACKTYVCLWRSSDQLLPADMFPAQAGFLLTIDNVATWPTTVNVCPDPATPDAWDTPRNRAIFQKLAAAWNCSVSVTGEGTVARHVFTAAGGSYAPQDRPELFHDGGRALALTEDDFGPDRRPPGQRIAEAGFGWDAP
jgi:hypothetical protein